MINNKYSGLLIIPYFLLWIFLGYEGHSQAEKIDSSIEKQSFIYSVKDSNQLGLDIYRSYNADSIHKKPCVIFVFGGAFVTGRRDDSLYNHYFNNLVEHGYEVVSISYRLGLRGVQHVSKFNIAPLRKAVNMAVEDLYDATNWVITHAGQFGVDTSKIILSGSSSGAITALTAEFQRRNEKPAAYLLPAGFEYAGVISFAGAVLSFDGSLKYKIKPAPYLMFHGTADKIVTYRKIRFLNRGFYGSAWIAKIFKKNNSPYYLYSEEGMGHEVSFYPMLNNIPVILDFLDKYIILKKSYQVEMLFKDPNAKPLMLETPDELFKKLQSTQATGKVN